MLSYLEYIYPSIIYPYHLSECSVKGVNIQVSLVVKESSRKEDPG